MKRKDLVYLGNVCALLAMCQCMDDTLDEIGGDLPEMLKEPYLTLRASIHAMIEGTENYRIAEAGTFMSACED